MKNINSENETGKYSILVVDDESFNIEALRQILKSEYIVYTASNGQSAVEMAEKHAPDLILLDIVMPEMDGYAVIDVLKSLKKTQDTPVIFITGLNTDDEEEKGLDLGAADYITKPFSLPNVRLRVKKQIETLAHLRSAERLSMFDQLTDLPNRRSFEARLNSEWGRALRDQTPISILFMDADKFKNYNDSFGHQQGDLALQALAKALNDTLRRPGDFSARWGGEEFIALLPSTDLHGAIGVAEQIRQNVESMNIPSTDKLAAKITVSIGINTLMPGHNSTMEEFIEGADAALYQAKEKGRNRVCYKDVK